MSESKPSLRDRISQVFTNREKIETALAAATLQDQHLQNDMARRRIAAEDAIGIRALGGTLASGDMPGDINIGDQQHTHTHAAPQPSGFARLAGKALLAGAIGGPAAFVAVEAIDSYFNRPAAPVAPDDTDTRTGIGLGDLNDVVFPGSE